MTLPETLQSIVPEEKMMGENNGRFGGGFGWNACRTQTLENLASLDLSDFGDIRRLRLIEEILVENSFGEDVQLDVARGRERTKTEIELAEVIAHIYRIIHPTGTCQNPHSDWEKETKKELESLSIERENK